MKQRTQINKTEWGKIELGEILDYEQPTNYIVESTDYKDEYETPVLTAGKSFILGYTNETNGICDKLPVIIFDDFTTDKKFVDFDFKVKSSAMKILRPKNELICLKFVFLAMQGLKFDAKRHKRYYLSAYQNLKIPMPFLNGKPDIQVQKAIVSILEKAEALKQKREQADKLTKDYLQSVFYEMFDNKGFPRAKLKELIIKIENKNPAKEFPEEYFKYIDISSIDNNIKKVVSTNKLLGKEAPSRAKQQVKTNDIILSTVRPNLNAVALIPRELNNQICSTGFCVLRLDKDKVTAEYIFMNLTDRKFIESMAKIAKGASYPAVSDKDILNSEIPLPPLPLQQKFASIVEQVEKLKEKQKQSKEEINLMFDSLMQKAFKGELVK